jgi:hypothetical protein
MVQLGNICSAFIYRADDKPLYHRGNTQLIIINLLAIFLFLLTKAYYVLRNRARDKKWNSMTPQEQREYKLNTKVVGSRRLDFRFAH